MDTGFIEEINHKLTPDANDFIPGIQIETA